MKVTMFRNGDGGCDFYRAVIPMEKCRERGLISLKETWAEKIVADIMLNQNKFKENMMADIYLIQRVNSLPFLKRMQTYIRENNPKSRIIVDFDDNVFDVSPLSNHYADYGTQDVKFKLPDGTEQYAWKDGENGFDLKMNQDRLEQIKTIVGEADMITVTTPILADVFREFNENVRVLPNCVDLKDWAPIDFPEKKEIRLYWGGGMSHWEDLLLIREPLRAIFQKYEHAKIVMLGWMPAGFEQTFPGRVEFMEWKNFHAYSYKMASLNIDIGLIPLVDNKFNRCKSNIKWVEMSALRIPSVVSYVSPYKEVNDLSDMNLGVFVEGNGSEGWIKGISTLVDNPSLRKEIGANARSVVEQHFDINSQHHLWVNAYGEALCQPPRTQPSPS